MADTTALDSLKRRLTKLGIELDLVANYPWIYIDKINGKKVIERFEGEHGFTVAFLPQRGRKMEITDIGKVMELIRKYTITCPHIWAVGSTCRIENCKYPKCLRNH